MITEYKNRLVCVAPKGNVNAINVRIAQVDPIYADQYLGQDLGLSANGQGLPTHHWFSITYKDTEIPQWTGVLGDFGASTVWTWNMYGDNDYLSSYWSQFGNVTLQPVTPQGVLDAIGKKRIVLD